jgi:glycine betaine/choline ABC-type transport system substrate-binding protein
VNERRKGRNMRKLFIFLSITAALFLAFGRQSDACVGKTLYIGAMDSTYEQLFSEMLLVLISERTGTTVNIKYYKDSRELYNAVKKNEVGILVENTDRALDMLGRQREQNLEAAYRIAKEEFRRNLNLVWLKPFGFSGYSPILTVDVLSNFPALPRVINKLGGIMNEEIFSKMVRSVKSGEKPKTVAREFLKARKLI